MGTFFNSGEENGIKWDINWKNGWEIIVSKGDIVKSITIDGHPPVCGVDIEDYYRVNEALDKLIEEF